MKKLIVTLGFGLLAACASPGPVVNAAAPVETPCLVKGPELLKRDPAFSVGVQVNVWLAQAKRASSANPRFDIGYMAIVNGLILAKQEFSTLDPKTEDMLLQQADLLDKKLGECGSDKVSLRQELREHYLALLVEREVRSVH